jgi:1-acyl-sn-glycerol-3-phosphate acyltransferase
MQTIYIDRDKLKDTFRVNEQIRDRMNKGYGVVVFAESKCSEEGTVMPFKPALLQSAVELGLPVHYASLHYATPEGQPPASEKVIWKGETGFVEHYIDVAGLPRVHATIRFGEEPITRSCRKVLAIDLHAAVSARFAPIE